MSDLSYASVNARIAYPFLSSSVAYDTIGWSNSWVADAGITIRPGAGIADGTAVELNNITRASSSTTFTFTPEGDSSTVLLQVTVPDSGGDGASAMASSSLAFGFVQVGISADLSALADGSYDAIGAAELETGRVANLSRQRVASVSVANKHGVGIDSDGTTLPEEADPYTIEATGLTGDLQLLPGRFCVITEDPSSRRITVSPVTDPLDGGELPCGDFADDQLTERPAGHTEPTDCGTIISSLNGVTASDGSGFIGLFAGPGVTITTGSSSITVTFDRGALRSD